MGFWDFLPKIPCYPHCGCEVMTYGVIEQPLAFWSSLAYAVSAYVLSKRMKDASLRFKLWITYVYLLSFSSLFTHASFSKIAVAMDFGSILILFSFFSLYKRLGRFSPLGQSALSFIYFALLSIGIYWLEKWLKVGLCLVIFFISLADLVKEETWSFLKARDFLRILGVLFFSFALFLMDESKLYCDPNGWFHGHTFWHLGTSAAIYLFGKWRFREDV